MEFSKIESLLDPKYSNSLNLKHIMHVFEGYSSREEDSNPYSTGSARHESWELGLKLRKEDN